MRTRTDLPVGAADLPAAPTASGRVALESSAPQPAGAAHMHTGRHDVSLLQSMSTAASSLANWRPPAMGSPDVRFAARCTGPRRGPQFAGQAATIRPEHAASRCEAREAW